MSLKCLCNLYQIQYISGHNNGTNETVFITIYGTRSWPHLYAVNNLYLARYGYPLELIIRENLEYSIYDSLMNVCKNN